jgi:hypothetical protein
MSGINTATNNYNGTSVKYLHKKQKFQIIKNQVYDTKTISKTE